MNFIRYFLLFSSWLHLSVLSNCYSNGRSWPDGGSGCPEREKRWQWRVQTPTAPWPPWTRSWSLWAPTSTTSTTASQTARPTSCRWRRPRSGGGESQKPMSFVERKVGIFTLATMPKLEFSKLLVTKLWHVDCINIVNNITQCFVMLPHYLVYACTGL